MSLPNKLPEMGAVVPFGDARRVVLGFRSGVGDEHDQVVGLDLVGRVGDGDRELVGDGVVAGSVILGRTVLLVAVGDLAAGGVVAGQRELAFGAGDDTRVVGLSALAARPR